MFPEYHDLIQIENVFIKNFNLNSSAGINTNLAMFLEEVGSRAQETFDRFMKIMETYEHVSKDSFSDEELQQLDRLSCEVVTLMTTLMFSIEQFIYKKKDQESIHHVFDESNPDESQEIATIDLFSEEALTSITKWIACLHFKKVSPHIKCTLLQLIFLVSDLERGLARLKANDIVSILAHLLKEAIDNHSNLGAVEERVILHTILKMLLKDIEMVPEIISEFLEIFRIYLQKEIPGVKEIIENIMGVIVTDIKYGREALLNLNKDQELISVSTLAHGNPKEFAKDKVWRKVEEKEPIDLQYANLMNTLYQAGPDFAVKFPVVSDYALKPLPHPSVECLERVEEIENFIKSLSGEHLEK
mmetsp:Transcript_31714/g.36629  ORF Transcript_31714/g.36629 Transcript_31714/m.36629 type:complete len:359 (+) Transcript_31714:2-1078(+)